MKSALLTFSFPSNCSWQMEINDQIPLEKTPGNSSISTSWAAQGVTLDRVQTRECLMNSRSSPASKPFPRGHPWAAQTLLQPPPVCHIPHSSSWNPKMDSRGRASRNLLCRGLSLAQSLEAADLTWHQFSNRIQYQICHKKAAAA